MDLPNENAIITRGIPVSIVPRPAETPAESLVRQLDTYRAINTLVDMLFVEGEDYGIQEGTNNYALKIPGIEKTMGMLGLREEYHDIAVIREYDRDNPFFYYEVECVMYSLATGQELVRGQGVCHTREKSFTKQANRKCPKCGTEAIFRSKNEGEGWYCWKKEGGCGAQFAKDEAAITSQKVGNVTDPQSVWDGINRARKVANKRAASSAIRRLAMLSGGFVRRKGNGTTDIRYSPEEIKALKAARATPVISAVPSASQAAQTLSSNGGRINTGVNVNGNAGATQKAAEPDAPPAPKTAKECLEDETCKKDFEALCKELNVMTTADHAPYLKELGGLKGYSDYSGTMDELRQKMRDLHKQFNTIVVVGNSEEPPPPNYNDDYLPHVSQVPNTGGNITTNKVEFNGKQVYVRIPNTDNRVIPCGDKAAFIGWLDKSEVGFAAMNQVSTWKGDTTNPKKEFTLSSDITVQYEVVNNANVLVNITVNSEPVPMGGSLH